MGEKKETQRRGAMMKFAIAALLVAAVFASDAEDTPMERQLFGVAGPTGRTDNEEDQAAIAAGNIAKMRATAACAGDRCEPQPPSCDPTVPGDCEKPMLAPTKVSCDSIQHCGPCTIHLHCGWKTKEKKCVEGGAAGPFSGEESVGDWDYAYCSQDPCSVYQSCSACSADPMCGWCSATNTCVEGSASGPWLNKCNKNSFSFDSCAMSVETPAVVTSSSLQANIQENAKLVNNA